MHFLLPNFCHAKNYIKQFTKMGMKPMICQKIKEFKLLIGPEQNLRELSVNMISILHESQFSIFFLILSKKLADVCVISCEFVKFELKWNVILWNAKNRFWAWIFREREFTDPSLKIHTLTTFSEPTRQFLAAKSRWM